MSFITVNITSLNKRPTPNSQITFNVDYIQQIYSDGNGGSIIHYNDDILLNKAIYYSPESVEELNDLIESSNRSVNGFIDYNDTTGSFSITSNTWVDVPNNGLGAFTNKNYKPTSINEVLDVSTGYLDFSDLALGSQLLIRNDFTVTPNTNNSLLEVRYLLGQGTGEYTLKFWSERLDSGSGVGYQRVISFPIYIGDTNTQGGVGKLQVKLSTNGTLNNAGSYIKIDLR